MDKFRLEKSSRRPYRTSGGVKRVKRPSIDFLYTATSESQLIDTFESDIDVEFDDSLVVSRGSSIVQQSLNFFTLAPSRRGYFARVTFPYVLSKNEEPRLTMRLSNETGSGSAYFGTGGVLSYVDSPRFAQGLFASEAVIKNSGSSLLLFVLTMTNTSSEDILVGNSSVAAARIEIYQL